MGHWPVAAGDSPAGLVSVNRACRRELILLTSTNPPAARRSTSPWGGNCSGRRVVERRSVRYFARVKVAIVGCGALGSYYGARLCRAGHETHFLLRSDFEAVAQNGVRIVGLPEPELEFQVQPRCSRGPEEIGACDLIVIGLKTTANALLEGIVPVLLGRNSVLLTMQNGLGNETVLEPIAPASRILGGLAYVSLNRIAPGIVRCQDPGTVVLGEWRGPMTERTQALAETFQRAGVNTTATDNLLRERWRKLVWNIPFNGLSTLGAAGIENLLSGRQSKGPTGDAVVPTDCLLADPRWRGLVRQIMLETIQVARALGHGLPDRLADEELARTVTMGSYKPSTAVDFELGRPLELEAIFGEPFRQAIRSGVPVPKFAGLVCGLRVRAGWG